MTDTRAKLAYTVQEASEASGLSVTVIREAIKRNDLPAKRSGTKLIIPLTSLDFFIEHLPDA